MSVLPDDQINSVINCLTAKSTWDDLILYYEGSSDVKESRVMDLKLCYNTFKFKEDSLYETEKNKSLVSTTPLSTAFFSTSIVQDFQDSPDNEEDTRSSHEYLNDLEEEYQVRALLAKSKRFFKKVTQRKTKDFEAKYHKVKAKLVLLSSSALTPSSSSGKNKGLTAEPYDWVNEEVSYDENEVTKVKALMALTDEEKVSVGKGSARNADNSDMSITSSNIPKSSETKDSTLTNQDTDEVPSNESQRNTTDPLVVISDSSTTDYNSADESSVCSTPILSLRKLDGVEPISEPKTIKSILKSKSTFIAENLKGIIINEPSSAPARGKISSASKTNSAPAGINPRNPQHVTKNCKTYGSNVHTTSDHNDIEWFRKRKTLQAKNVESFKASKNDPSSALRSKTPTKSMNKKSTSDLLQDSPAIKVLNKKVENPKLEEQLPPIDTMTDNRTMTEMLRAPTEGWQFVGKKHSRCANDHRKQIEAPVKAVEETCVTCGDAHPYYQCPVAGGNTFPEFRDNIQGYVSAAAGNYNQGNPDYRPQGVANQMRPPGSGSLPSNTVANPKGELKAITTHSGLVTDGPTVPTPPKSITPEVGERVEETYRDPDLAEYTIKVLPPPVQKYKPPSQRDFVVHKRDPLHLNIPYPSRMLKQKYSHAKVPKMLKALLSNKEKLQELANTHLNENCSAVIQKKLPKKLGDPGKFLIPCGFSELKCKALADLGASINLMPLSVWKELGLPELIPTCMTLKLANRAICTPAGIARDVFVSVGKFTFPDDFVVVDYESDPRVPLILGRPFLRTTCALIDVHGEEMILHFLEVSVLNKPSGNPTFSLHQELTSPEVNHDIHDSEGCNLIHPYFDDDPLSGSTTYSANPLLEEFTDELALITYPLDYDDNLQFDIESNLKEIEFMLYQGKDSSLKDSIDQTDLANLDDYFVDPTPEMFTDEHAPDYSSPPIFDVYDDDFLEVESDAYNVYDDPVDALPSTNNEDKVFNTGILIHEKPVKIITRVAQEKKLAISNASLLLEDFDPPFCEPLFFKDVPKSKMLLQFSSENEEKVFKPWIYTAEKLSSIPGNMKNLAKGFCIQVFISSSLIGNH
nr:hypothetical protein [Tanacetum cinerariifolium]